MTSSRFCSVQVTVVLLDPREQRETQDSKENQEILELKVRFICYEL